MYTTCDFSDHCMFFCFVFKKKTAWKAGGGRWGSRGEVGKADPELGEASDCEPARLVLRGLLETKGQQGVRWPKASDRCST